MPESIESRRKRLVNASRNFYVNVQRTFADSEKKYIALVQMHQKLKESNASDAIVTQRTNKFFKWHPEFQNQVIGFHPDGILKLKETETRIRAAPINPPARFTRDTMLSVLEFMPHRVICRLAMTCKWMDANITTEHVERALAKCRALFAKVQIYSEPSSGRQMFRVYNADWEMVEVGRLNPSSSMFVLKADGRTYLGNACVGLWATSMAEVLTGGSMDGRRLWFEYASIGNYTSEKLVIDFEVTEDKKMYHSCCRMTFELFVQ